jgi:hypothetical protein
VIAVSLLGVFLASAFTQSDLPTELESNAVFDDVDFLTNEELRRLLATTSATPEQVEVAIEIHEDARRRALQASFFIVAGISLLSILPTRRLPGYVPEELSAVEIVSEEG